MPAGAHSIIHEEQMGKLFPTVTGEMFARSIARAKTEKNSVAEQIRAAEISILR